MKYVPLALLTMSLSTAQAQFPANPQNTYVVIAGALEWKDALSPFDKKNRKDKELSEKLASMGIPTANITTLLDAQATKKNMETALQTVATKADANSTIVFYYAGHGMNEEDGIYFANYDVDLDAIGQTGFALRYLSETLGKSKASQIWLLADCCYSGGLLAECKKLGDAGKQVVALSSATASNVSTGNWTYTQTLLDCLAGNSLADQNRDGSISLEELKRELRQAMKNRERQLNGAEWYNVDDKMVFAKAPLGKTIESGSKFTVGSYAWGRNGQNWEPVRVLSNNNNSFLVQFYHYSDKENRTLTADDIREMYFVPHEKGAAVQVEWEGKWFPATIAKVSGDFYYIRYDGYGEEWSEWVLYDRIRTGKEKKVQVLDQGEYYPAEVLEEKDGRFFIHYKNYDNSWDEWVDASRIKK